MKEKKIEIVKVVNEDGCASENLFAIEYGTRPNKEVVTKAVYKYFGDFQSDGDEVCYQYVIDELCHNRGVEMFGDSFSFETVTLYEL